jgi:CO dehydrogenase/acetyl-CoA synthase delta subunit
MAGTHRGPPGSIRIDSQWTPADLRGAVRCRLGRFRMRYSVPPGLSALGRPGPDSPVVVTANYKLTFDILRRDLSPIDCWILALETRGINVWCASAGGTFVTEELVLRLGKTRLSEVVRHRELIVPQLCAPGVSAHSVQKQSGFHVRFGPVRSCDLPSYLSKGKASPSMRRVRFETPDRLALVPVELGRALKLFLVFAFAVILFAGLSPAGVVLQKAWNGAWPLFALGMGAALAGSFLVPLLLPFLPFRAFTPKGWLVGAVVTGALLHGAGLAGGMDRFLIAACWLFFPAAAAYLAFSFTGASTFTSPSGVRREVRAALPFFAAAAVLTAAALALSKVTTWGRP